MEFGTVLELPTCLEEYKPELDLSVTDRQELIHRLARTGPKAIGKFVTSHEDDSKSGIARLVKRLRAKFEHQVRMSRERIESKYNRQKEQVISEMKHQYRNGDRLTKFESEAKTGYETDYINRELNSRLNDILAQDDLINFIIIMEQILH